MKNYIYLNSFNHVEPAWESISADNWQTILEDFVFKIADSFAFMKVATKKDLEPIGLNYFKTWELNEKGLIELQTETVVKFDLNESCKKKLIQFDFARHEFGMNPPRSYNEFDELNYYYEFDELYFFSGNRQILSYIHHESIISFENLTDIEIYLLNKLDKNILIDITESEV